MNITIARLPLIPAFLTLLALALTAVCAGEGHAVASIAQASSDTFGSPNLVGKTLPQLIDTFQLQQPSWSRVIACVLILFAGLTTGRLTVRYNLYAVHSCLSMPLYGIIACGIWPGEEFLLACVASALLTLAMKNFSRACTVGYGFDAIFGASFYLAMTIMVIPAALPLVLLLPTAVLLFRRTLRELIVALAGLLLPPLVLCYVNWGAGGDFMAPLQVIAQLFTQGTLFGFFLQNSLIQFILPGIVVGLNLLALWMFLFDVHTLSNRPRLILIFNICAVFLLATLFCSPAASPAFFALLAVPSAVLLPVLFIRVKSSVALPLYLLLLAGAFIGAILQ